MSKKGWIGIKLDAANAVLESFDIEIQRNELEKNYFAVHPVSQSKLRRDSITALFIAILKNWMELKP